MAFYEVVFRGKVVRTEANSEARAERNVIMPFLLEVSAWCVDDYESELPRKISEVRRKEE